MRTPWRGQVTEGRDAVDCDGQLGGRGLPENESRRGKPAGLDTAMHRQDAGMPLDDANGARRDPLARQLCDEGAWSPSVQK